MDPEHCNFPFLRNLNTNLDVLKGRLRDIMIAVSSVADLDTGSGAFMTPVSGMGKKPGSRSGMNNPDHISESL